jgi:hypothetical protein
MDGYTELLQCRYAIRLKISTGKCRRMQGFAWCVDDDQISRAGRRGGRTRQRHVVVGRNGGR